MAIGDLYYLKWKFTDTDSGEVFTPGLHVKQEGVGFDFNGGAERMVEFWVGSHGITGGLKSWYPTSMELTSILGRRVKPLEPVEQEYTTGLPVDGTLADDQLSLAVSPLISLRTAKIGRSYRGRIFLPAPGESKENADGMLSVADAEALADQANNLRVTLEDIGVNLKQVIYSRLLDSGENVTRVLVDRRLRTQRRRQIETPVYVTP